MAGKLRGVGYCAPPKRAPKKSLSDGWELYRVPRVKESNLLGLLGREEGDRWVLCAAKFEMDYGMALEATLTRVCSCSLFRIPMTW